MVQEDALQTFFEDVVTKSSKPVTAAGGTDCGAHLVALLSTLLARLHRAQSCFRQLGYRLDNDSR